MEDTPDHLRCPICFEVPTDKVFQCRDGHILCEECYNQVDDCPQCRVRFDRNTPIRNRHFEGMLDHLTINCPNKSLGCEETGLRSVIRSHLETCRYKPPEMQNICKLIGYSNCTYKVRKGKATDALEHFESVHALPTCYDTARVELADFTMIASNTNSTSGQMWKPIIINRVADECTFIILILLEPKSISMSALYMDYSSEKDQQFQVAFSIAGQEKSLRLSVQPLNIFKAEAFPPFWQLRVEVDTLLKEWVVGRSLFLTINGVKYEKGLDLWKRGENDMILTAADMIKFKRREEQESSSIITNPSPYAPRNFGAFEWIPRQDIPRHLHRLSYFGFNRSWKAYICRMCYGHTTIMNIVGHFCVSNSNRPEYMTKFGVIDSAIENGANQWPVEILHIPNGSVLWIPCIGSIPENALSLGTDPTGGYAFVGRAQTSNDSMSLGRISNGRFHRFNKEKWTGPFEILVLTEVGKALAILDENGIYTL